MAERNLMILIEVQGAQAAEVQLAGVAGVTKEIGTASVVASPKASKLTGALKGLAAGYLLFKGAQFLKESISETVSLGVATAQLQRITGMDTATASGWAKMAKERNISAKQLNFGFITLSRQMTAASDGSKTATKTFDALGISQRQLAKMNTNQVVGRVADAFQKMKNPAERAALAQRLFGRNAQAMLPLLIKGSAALNKNVEETSRSAKVTGDTVKQSLAAVKAQREWSATLTGIRVAIGTALLPILTQLMKTVLPVIKGFADLVTHSKAFRTVVLAVTGALLALWLTMKVVSLSEKLFGTGWVGIAILIAVALVTLYMKCKWFRDIVQAVFRGVVAAFNWVKNAAINAFNWISKNWPLLVSIILLPFGGPVLVQIIKHFGAIKDFIIGAFQAMWHFGQGFVGFLTGAFKAAWDVVYGAIHGVVVIVQQLLNWIGKIASVPSKVIGLIGKGVGAIGGVLGLGQTGLYASQAGPAIVGEKGPEMVTLPQGARVHPFRQSRSGGGGELGPIHTHVYLDGRQIALAIGNHVAGVQAAR